MADKIARTIICQHCGRTVTVIGGSHNRVYCSKRCRRAATDRSKKLVPCKYQEGVACAGQHCERCGWNPEVARERAINILRELGVPV